MVCGLDVRLRRVVGSVGGYHSFFSIIEPAMGRMGRRSCGGRSMRMDPTAPEHRFDCQNTDVNRLVDRNRSFDRPIDRTRERSIARRRRREPEPLRWLKKNGHQEVGWVCWLFRGMTREREGGAWHFDTHRRVCVSRVIGPQSSHPSFDLIGKLDRMGGGTHV